MVSGGAAAPTPKLLIPSAALLLAAGLVSCNGEATGPGELAVQRQALRDADAPDVGAEADGEPSDAGLEVPVAAGAPDEAGTGLAGDSVLPSPTPPSSSPRPTRASAMPSR